MVSSHLPIHSLITDSDFGRSVASLDIDNATLSRLAGLSLQQQWILFTAECPRPDYQQFAAFDVSCKKVIQMKPSQNQSEFEIVKKAIQSGNASAVVASSNISLFEQRLLHAHADEFQCEVFFVEGRVNQYH